jgi:8-amino-7-oxononanoate synthase
VKILERKKIKKSFVKNFYENHPDFMPTNDPLLDIRAAHHWFDLLKYGDDTDQYNFQEVIQGKGGAEVIIRDKSFYMMSSYDYLGLIGHPKIESAAIDAIREYGTGTGGVRLLTGTNELHCELEKSISQFIGTGSAMALSSGYMANVAAIAGLFDRNDLVVADERIHRSIADAFKIAGVPSVYFKHNDLLSLKELLEKHRDQKRKLIVVEGVYSMDGDICPLPEIVRLKNEYESFLMLDEAHSLGVLGATGRGATEHFGIDPDCIDILTGSLSKAIPTNGGFIAAREEVIVYLKHGGSPFMFSAALSPANTAASIKSFEIIDEEPWRLKMLWKNVELFIQSFRKYNIDISQSQSPIIPVICGQKERAFTLSKKLFDRGFLANAVVFPAVPASRARLRLCCTAAHTENIIQIFTNVLSEEFFLL